MKKIKLAEGLEVSQFIHGYWRLKEWNISEAQLLNLIKQIIDLGITTFDHADIYGDYDCEKIFGDALSLNKSLRSKIQLITKCGIQLLSDKFPHRKVKHYEYSYEHIVFSVNSSLKKFQTDYIDLLLLHRPSPFFNPEEVAKAFSYLKKEGKVLHFGVSNFDIQQFELLSAYTDEKLVTNQIEISPYCLEHFENGNLNFLMKNKIIPLAWSPLAGGELFNPTTEKGKRLHKTLKKICNELQIYDLELLIYAWVMKHPSKSIPIIGSSKIERINLAVQSLNLEINLEQWMEIYISSQGIELP